MKYTLFIVISIMFLSCSHPTTSNPPRQNDSLLILNLDSAPIEDSLYASTFIASVTPIVLETTDDNLIGLFCGMQVTEKYICILDGAHNGSGNLYVFDKKGKYLRKIGEKGQGPGEFLYIQDFTINEKEDIIYMVDSNADKIKTYQLSTGKFLKDLDFKDDEVSYGNIQYCNNKLFVDFTYYTLKEKGPMLYRLNEETGDIESNYLDIDVHNHGWLRPFFKGESFFYCKNSASPKYTHYFMDTIMSIKNNQLAPYLVIKSKDWATEKDVKGNKNTTPDAENDVLFKIEDFPVAFNVQNYVESEEYIYFSYSKQRKFINALYNKKNNTLLQANRFIDDIMYKDYYQLPLIGCGDENGMYGYIHTVSIPNFYKNINHPSCNMKPEYIDFFKKNLTPDSNPIILYYEYKK